MSTDPDDQTLHRRITPTDEQQSSQQTRWNELASYLCPLLKEESGYNVRTWLQGSYKFATQIRPVSKGEEFDIDLGIYLEWSGGPDDGLYGPVEIKRMVQGALQEYSSEDVKDVISPPKERCSRIRFDGDFHIDLPAYHLDPKADSRALATENHGWENSDPKQLVLWFQQLFNGDERAKARRLIRYLKCWAALKFRDASRRPSSTLLTVLVSEAFADLTEAERGADDEALASVLEKIVARLESNSEVVNPVDSEEVLSARMPKESVGEFLNQLRGLEQTAHDALSQSDVSSGATVWGEAFEHFFPIPSQSELRKAISEGRLPGTLSTNSALHLPVRPEIRIRAISRINPNREFSATNDIGPIPKNCDIHFEVVNRDMIPSGAHIEWMVRNEGSEAESLNDLGHRAGTEWKAKETSAYVGTHFMDCVVKIDGQIVGMRRASVTIDNQRVPKR